jgi:hypothetical protein
MLVDMRLFGVVGYLFALQKLIFYQSNLLDTLDNILVEINLVQSVKVVRHVPLGVRQFFSE